MITAAVVTFVAVLMCLLTGYWALFLRPEQQAQRALLKRLKISRPTTGAVLGLRKTVQHLSSIPSLDAAMRRSRDVLGPLERLLQQANVRMTVSLLLLTAALLGLVVGAVVTMLTGRLLPALPLAACAAWLPFALLQWKRARRILKFEEQFPEALDLLSRGLKAGHAFTSGLSMVADELPEPVGPEFRTLFDQQNYGMPIGEALRLFAGRIPVIDARFFVTAVMTQREAGGNLSEILDNLATVIRDRFQVKRQIRVISAHGRITGLVLTAVPPLLALALFVISPAHFSTLFTDPLGPRLILAAIVLQITGGLIIRKLVRITY